MKNLKVVGLSALAVLALSSCTFQEAWQNTGSFFTEKIPGFVDNIFHPGKEETPVTVTGTSLKLDNVKVEFNKGDTFTTDGLLALVSKSDNTSSEVTEFEIKTAPNMGQLGDQTVEVSYVYEGVTYTGSYTINVAGFTEEEVDVAFTLLSEIEGFETFPYLRGMRVVKENLDEVTGFYDDWHIELANASTSVFDNYVDTLLAIDEVVVEEDEGEIYETTFKVEMGPEVTGLANYYGLNEDNCAVLKLVPYYGYTDSKGVSYNIRAYRYDEYIIVGLTSDNTLIVRNRLVNSLPEASVMALNVETNVLQGSGYYAFNQETDLLKLITTEYLDALRMYAGAYNTIGTATENVYVVPDLTDTNAIFFMTNLQTVYPFSFYYDNFDLAINYVLADSKPADRDSYIAKLVDAGFELDVEESEEGEYDVYALDDFFGGYAEIVVYSYETENVTMDGVNYLPGFNFDILFSAPEYGPFSKVEAFAYGDIFERLNITEETEGLEIYDLLVEYENFAFELEAALPNALQGLDAEAVANALINMYFSDLEVSQPILPCLEEEYDGWYETIVNNGKWELYLSIGLGEGDTFITHCEIYEYEAPTEYETFAREVVLPLIGYSTDQRAWTFTEGFNSVEATVHKTLTETVTSAQAAQSLLSALTPATGALFEIKERLDVDENGVATFAVNTIAEVGETPEFDVKFSVVVTEGEEEEPDTLSISLEVSDYVDPIPADLTANKLLTGIVQNMTGLEDVSKYVKETSTGSGVYNFSNVIATVSQANYNSAWANTCQNLVLTSIPTYVKMAGGAYSHESFISGNLLPYNLFVTSDGSLQLELCLQTVLVQQGVVGFVVKATVGPTIVPTGTPDFANAEEFTVDLLRNITGREDVSNFYEYEEADDDYAISLVLGQVAYNANQTKYDLTMSFVASLPSYMTNYSGDAYSFVAITSFGGGNYGLVFETSDGKYQLQMSFGIAHDDEQSPTVTQYYVLMWAFEA